MRATPLLDVRDLTTSFPGVVANDDISLTVTAGEVHGLLGENGAGKTTLARVLMGIERPDRGEIRIAGERVAIRSPRDARALGLAMVHQHFSLCPGLTVAENVALSERRGGAGRLRLADAAQRVEAVANRYGLGVDSRRRVAELGVGERQRVEILRCLLGSPRILILDEPTAVLGRDETYQLLTLVRRLAGEGCAVVLITHKLEELVTATERITVLRDGRVVETVETHSVDTRRLARLMVGREVSLRAAALSVEAAVQAGAEATADRGRVVLRVDDLHVTGPARRVLLDGVNLEVHAGEIVGIAGVEGNGQATLADAVSGMVPVTRGRVVLGDSDLTALPPGDRLRLGLAVIPEDRHERGCAVQMTVAENLAFREWATVFPLKGAVSRRRMDARAWTLMREYGITGATPWTPMGALSGGNQQRVVVARELSSNPRAIVAVHPTRGIDVGGIEQITERLHRARDAGVAVLLVSNELEEVLSLADRVGVMYRGRIVAVMERGAYDLERIGHLMAGVTAPDGATA